MIYCDITFERGNIITFLTKESKGLDVISGLMRAIYEDKGPINSLPEIGKNIKWFSQA